MGRLERRTCQATPEGGNRGFWSHLALGMGALTMLQARRFNPPKYRGDGQRGDWRVVGNGIRSAMRRLNDHEES